MAPNTMPQLFIGGDNTDRDGDMMLRGKAIDSKTPVSAVVYVDSRGVFEKSSQESDYEFAYANINGEGRRDYTNGEECNFYYIKDHLGSTRMVINEDCDILESYAYSAYGIEEKIDVSGGMATREGFTGKEFDTEGQVDGVAEGMNLNYFGARYYDPVVGVWTSTDAAKQFFNSYGYTTSPIIMVDPDGNYVIGALVGGAVGFVAGGFIGGAVDSDNNSAWSWSGAFQGMMIGASLGSGIEDAINASEYWKNGITGMSNYRTNAINHIQKTGYLDSKIVPKENALIHQGKYSEYYDIIQTEAGRLSHSIMPKDKNTYLSFFQSNKAGMVDNVVDHVGIYHEGMVGHFTEGKFSFEIPELIYPTLKYRYYNPVTLLPY